MLITLRNLFVNIIAAFIRDSNMRHRFRNKYKRKSKYRKLRDDNKIIVHTVGLLNDRLNNIYSEINEIKRVSLSINLLRALDEPFKDYISIACIAKNEGPYLKEWIEYHKIIGVERFYFYDNESDDNTKEVLTPYIDNGLVIYQYTPGIAMQNPVYQDAVLKAKDKTRWLALIDLDEFIVPKEDDNIRDFLKEYEAYPGVGINWVLFDSNSHVKRPTSYGGLVTYNYTRVRKDYNYHRVENGKYVEKANLHIKSIVNPREVIDITNPHFAFYRSGQLAVTENFEPIYITPTWHGQTKFWSGNKIQLNHYHKKSREEYIERVKKGHPLKQRVRYYNEAALNFKQETTNDYAIRKFLPELKAAMNIVD